MPARPVTRIYEDPLDVIWLACVKQIGFRLERDDEVFASWDGCNCLRLGRESLDDDDCLAQLVLHELCHGIVEGPLAWNLPDWGLNSFPKKSREHEFAALRLQAALADHVGLRNFFSATTDFFEYYRVIPTEPLHHSNWHQQLFLLI